MNCLTKSLTLTLLLAGACASHSQGFVNLNFENAKIIPTAPFIIATTNALPGWNVFYGSNQQSQVTFNDPAIGSTYVTLWATNGYQIAGKYSVLLQGGLTASAATISQTALVQMASESLLFEAQPGDGTLLVSLGGQNLSFSAIAAGSNYTLYGANIPQALAGQVSELDFSALEGGRNIWNIDNIQFSSVAVPEPGILTLSTVGSMFLLWHRRKNYPR